ncbi:MAG: hypothetical protein BEN18_10905 [Epulopiscium sp. Nuni2H_MBin001]|nr:MAG: hypothetical protein BEN18_10905 [Epulopiscium sp. Nuni2H_MBin001]
MNSEFMEHVADKLSQVNSSDVTQLLTTIMALSQDAEKFNVAMTKEQQNDLIAQLRDTLPANKRPQFDMLIEMLCNQTL